MENFNRYRLLLILLVGTLGLSVGLNFYCLRQLEAPPPAYGLEDGLPAPEVELELAQMRAQLAACEQATQPLPRRPDTLNRASVAF